ncbi:MAG: hypothetical protein IPL99_26300 [Candidatus Competibacteraceae bacterium]|nr:hypothetical protein [Candidatus Competibacteraceae bacterium]
MVNLLFDGQGFWLIDHGLALRVDPATVTVNHLMTTAIAARTDELARQRLKREVTQIYASYTDDLLLAAEQIIATADILNAAIPLNQGLHFLRRRWLALNSTTALRIRTTRRPADYDTGDHSTRFFRLSKTSRLSSPLVARVLGTNKGSGERLTALIDCDGRRWRGGGYQSIRLDTLDCMYGAYAKTPKDF